MIGFRGASRYYSPLYREGFALECRAIRRLRIEMGFRNVIVMIPFCRSTREADQVLEVMAANGLRRGEDGLEVFVMCEIPNNVIEIDADGCTRLAPTLPPTSPFRGPPCRLVLQWTLTTWRSWLPNRARATR